MPVNTDIFKYATAVRDSVTKEQQEYIESAYAQWSEDVLKQAEYYGKLTTGSSPVSQTYYQQLYKQMQAQSKEIANGVYTNIVDGMAKVSDAVVKDAVDWTSSFGISKKGLDAAFSYVPQSTVNSLITGSVYGKPGSWSLSAAIWGDNEKTLKDIYSIMSQGVAMQMPIEDIANKLSQYVSPTKQLMWTGPSGMRIYKHAVDYNAQRLARTLVQHTYQQSFVAATKDNPFVTEYVWNANGSRVCPICADRDGTHYDKDKLPLDHPNGMCTMEPVVDDNIVDKLANWVNGEDGTYPEIDEFAKKFGYDITKLPKMTLKDIKNQYGNSQYKYANVWYKKLPKDVQKTVSQIQQASGKNLNQWYKDEIMDKTLKKTTEKTAKKTVKKTAGKQADVTMQDMIEKYAKKLKQSSSDFMYLGKMSTDNFIDSLYDDEIDDISKWMAKNFGLDVSTGSKKDKAVAKWIEEAFSKIDDMNYSEKDKLKSIANSIISSPPSSKKIDSIDDVLKTATKAVNKTTPKAVDKVVVKNATGNDKILGRLFDNFKSQTTKEMLSIEDKELSSLTKTQLKMLRRYTGSGYGEINDYLRKTANGGIYKGYLGKEDIDDIKDAVKAFSEITTKKDYALRRGTDANDIFYTFLNGNPSMREKINDLVDSVETDLFASHGESNLQEHIGEINSLIQGQIGSFSSFTSTSSDWDKGFNGIVEYVIDAPKGTAGTSVMSISHYGTDEGEFLLAPGTKVVCEKVEAASDGHKRAAVRVFLKVIV